MDNDKRIEIGVAGARMVAGSDADGADALVELAETLRALGLGVDAGTGRGCALSLAIDFPDADAARVLATRNAGKKRTPADLSAIGLGAGSPVSEFLAWREGRPAEECAGALGLGRRSYFRRLREMRDAQAAFEAGELDAPPVMGDFQ